MKILVDAMGGDHAPLSIVQGAIDGAEKTEHDIVLIGDREAIAECFKKLKYKGSSIEVIHASEHIENNEAPVKAIRSKKDSPTVKGLNMIKEGDADVFLSAGSTGALLAGGIFVLGRIKGIDRPALATIYPVMGKEPSLLVDVGANTECKPINLVEFAHMGSIYMEKVLDRKNPKIGLLNNGAEENKGTLLTKEVHKILAESRLNFIGNVEARELPFGICDVIVTDGFTGNAVIKLTEGMGNLILKELKSMFLKNPKTKMAALLMKEQLKDLRLRMDYKEYGGAPILGVRGAVLKMHGSSDSVAVEKTILKAVDYVENNVVGLIEDSIGQIEEMFYSE